MKISVLRHDPKAHLPQRKGDATPITRNLDPLAHPFARARERTRALNAAKIERMFAKPFVASLEGHIDGVYTLATKAGDLETITSGSGDGEIIVHNLSTRRHLLKFPGAHKGIVSAITYAGGPRLLSCGVDRTIKLWDTSLRSDEEEGTTRALLNVFPGKVAFNDRTLPNGPTLRDDVEYRSTMGRNQVGTIISENANRQIDRTNRSSPVSDLTFPTSNETITALRFNLAESSILATTGTDRTLTLYDIRTGKAERRLVMQMRANALSWSPELLAAALERYHKARSALLNHSNKTPGALHFQSLMKHSHDQQPHNFGYLAVIKGRSYFCDIRPSNSLVDLAHGHFRVEPDNWRVDIQVACSMQSASAIEFSIKASTSLPSGLLTKRQVIRMARVLDMQSLPRIAPQLYLPVLPVHILRPFARNDKEF
ncbi:unnamed protein product [Rhizoctonia solani]|uniref:Uncharacterized protein n=1 Tax=Rhizoctonia solani TaxID=456999 RepID=A0A8H3CF25_9AGAM|nr:unnamed protein product [Rhizoctonia solani]